MWQVYGRKACVLTRGGLATGETDELQDRNPYSNIWLSCQKSAEVIVLWKDKRSRKD